MKNSGKCPKCGSTEIIADGKMIDPSHNARICVASYGKPQALIFKDQHKSTLSAWICGQCGHVELYADSAADLKIASD